MLDTIHFNAAELMRSLPDDLRNFMFIGRRRVGKSFSVKWFTLYQCFKNGWRFVYVRRRKQEMTAAVLDTVFDDINTKNELPDILREAGRGDLLEKYTIMRIERRGRAFYLVGDIVHEASATVESVRVEKIGDITSIRDAENFKEGTWPKTHVVLFDEFITRFGYISIGANTEPQLFKMIIETISADFPPYTFLLGNPDNEIDMCPYVSGYNIEYENIEPNTASIFKSGKSKLCFVKITGEKDDERFLSREVTDLFGSAHDTSITGEIDRPEAHTPPEDFRENYVPEIAFEIETTTLKLSSPAYFYKCIWGSVGTYNRKPAAYYSAHNVAKDQYIIHCFNNVKRNHEYEFAQYGLNFNAYPKVQRALNMCDELGTTFFENDKINNILLNLKEV